MEKYDVVVIGAGPAGYSAAVKLSKNGMRVACVFDGDVGGTCLNEGCIPTKTLLKAARDFSAAGSFGRAADAGAYYKKTLENIENVKSRLRKGIEFLFKTSDVVSLRGFAKIISRNEIDVALKDGTTEKIRADKILITAGCKMRKFPNIDYNPTRILTSSEALRLPNLPRSALIVGAGAIGCEFAQIWSSFGTGVTLIEMAKNILPTEDPECADVLRRVFRRSGICVKTSAKMLSVKTSGESVATTVESEGKMEEIESDCVLVCGGLSPDVKPLFAENLLPETDSRGFIKVDKNYRTSADNAYAAGDIIAAPTLAHAAEHEGELAADAIMKGKCDAFGECCSCVYTSPEIASIGMSESAAREKFGSVAKVSKVPFMVLGRAVADGNTDGFLKVVYNAEDGKILGAQIAGANAEDIVSVAAVALKKGATVDDLRSTIFPHPSYCEILKFV